MSSWTFERSILLNQQHIPLEKKSLSIIDPHDLGGSIEGLNLDEDLDVNLVSFEAAANVKWLAGPRGAIKVPFFWWRQRSSSIPLLMEIKDLIKQGKPGRRMPREQKSLVLVEVRGKILLVLNHPSQVSLALRGHPGALPGSFEDETSILGWFLTELEKDIKVMQEQPEQLKALQSQDSLESEPQPEEQKEAIVEGLERLNGPPQGAQCNLASIQEGLQGHQEGQEHL